MLPPRSVMRVGSRDCDKTVRSAVLASRVSEGGTLACIEWRYRAAIHFFVIILVLSAAVCVCVALQSKVPKADFRSKKQQRKKDDALEDNGQRDAHIASSLIVATTCAQFEQEALPDLIHHHGVRFSAVVFDECSQITLPIAAAIFYKTQAKRVLMFGDPKQLPPVLPFDEKVDWPCALNQLSVASCAAGLTASICLCWYVRVAAHRAEDQAANTHHITV